jgi:hypothetical protein
METTGLSSEGEMLARETSLGEWLLHRLPEGSPMRPEVLSLLATLYHHQFNISGVAERPQTRPTWERDREAMISELHRELVDNFPGVR